MSNQDIFNKIYLTNEWHVDSGTGSLPHNAVKYTEYVNGFIKAYNIKTILDLGSGDTKILRSLKIDTISSYKCVEVSNIAIERYYKKLPSKVELIQEDILDFEYPNVDLILIKDVLQHLDFNSISLVMNKIFNAAKYAIITNDIPHSGSNIEISNGQYRGLNLHKDPFNYFNLQIVKTYRSAEEEKAIYLYRKENEII